MNVLFHVLFHVIELIHGLYTYQVILIPYEPQVGKTIHRVDEKTVKNTSVTLSRQIRLYSKPPNLGRRIDYPN